MAAGAFDPAFHPIVNVKSGKIHHYEALVRFRGKAKDASPFREITFAEESDLIHEFDIMMAKGDRLALEETAQQRRLQCRGERFGQFDRQRHVSRSA